MKPVYNLIALAVLSVSLTLPSWARPVRVTNPKIEFQAPDIQPPSSFPSTYMLHGGPRCPNNYTHALIPSNQVGVTVKSTPTLFFHVDRRERGERIDSPETITLTLRLYSINAENEAETLYKIAATVTTEYLPGIVSFSIPEDVGSQLQIGQFYQWSLEISCGREAVDLDPDSSDRIGGFIYRIKPDNELVAKLAKARPIERVALYARKGIWDEALSELAQLHRSDPHNREVTVAWRSLLESAGFGTRYFVTLDQLVNAPLLNCCTVGKN
jgi:hypothetical protein